MRRPDRSDVLGQGGEWRVRADREGPFLRGQLCRDPPGLTLVPAGDLIRHDAATVRQWFSAGFLAPLVPDPHHQALAAWVANAGIGPGPLPLSAMYRERCGGRRYSFHIAGHAAERVWSERAFKATFRAGSRLLLPSIPRRYRGAFRAPPGHRYLVVDIDRCFPTLLGTVAQDDVLLHDARGDLHQRAGDAMAAHPSAAHRRELGKLFNNAVIGLISERGWHRELRTRGHRSTPRESASMHARWWDRYHRACRLRDAWCDLHRDAARQGVPLTIEYPDRRIYRFDVASVRGNGRGRGRRADGQRLEAAVRRSFSAIWRGVEGVILDCAVAQLHRFRTQGLRLVVPLYDGLLLQVPAGGDEWWALAVKQAMAHALAAVGVPGTVSVTVGSTWPGVKRPIVPLAP